ncbi:hypothetical protein CEP54_013983 [Fusarium duplospermum]|uniref:Xylanolytic transcriptional activator regulatory domain-containing protein n=1 Tax=Fusarium duplospermum TaxID=1325734 RepID=A0A428NZJ3_9HYPO|nr:hypothetical protein CEP54_013983 [Fusarium duplospermum]
MRNSVFGPGYLGSTSHASVFKETRDSLSILEQPDPEHAESETARQQSQLDIGFHDLPLPTRQMCLLVLQYLPGQRDACMVFHGDPSSASKKSWTHVAVARIIQSLQDIFRYFGQHDSPLERVADVLCRNTAQPIRDDLTSAKDWMDQLCGHNLRWEAIGLLWAHIEGLSDALGSLDPRQLQWVPGKESTELALTSLGYCIEISRHFTAGNALLLDLCRRNGTLGTLIYGDASSTFWESHSLAVSMMIFLGLHAQGGSKSQVQQEKPSFCTEYKRRLFSYIFFADKFVVSFSGRPPLISRRYCSTALPLDLQDEDLMSDETTLAEAMKTLDERGWNTKKKVHSVTFMRARMLLSYVLDELVEIALGNDPNVTLEYLESIKARQLKVFSEYPSSLVYKHEDLSDPNLDIKILYVRILTYLAHLRNIFLVERLLLQHGGVDEGNLLNTSFDLVRVTVVLWIHKDRFADMRRNFEWLLMAYAAPGGGILCQELLRPTFYGTHPLNSELSRSSIVQQLSLLAAFLNWVGPTAPNSIMCNDCQALIQRVLDQHLNTVTGNDTDLESFGSLLPHSLGFRFDLLNTFDWLQDGMEK